MSLRIRATPPSELSSTKVRLRCVVLAPRPRRQPPPLRYGSMAEITSRSSPVVDAPPPAAAAACNDDDIICEVCGRGDKPDKLLICDLCDGGPHHTFCLRPALDEVPDGPWVCPNCEPPPPPTPPPPQTASPPKRPPMKQRKIDEYFRALKDDQDGEPMRYWHSKGEMKRCEDYHGRIPGVYADSVAFQEQVSGYNQGFNSRDEVKQTRRAFGCVKPVTLMMMFVAVAFVLVKLY